jgi:Tol biopolymer transport system component/DNA-binding winged helix-turn-helix (wHTH) protein
VLIPGLKPNLKIPRPLIFFVFDGKIVLFIRSVYLAVFCHSKITDKKFNSDDCGDNLNGFSRGIMAVPFKQIYEFEKFRLDPRERILLEGGRPVELTPKGFELLSVFVENHGRLLEKDELMDKIWADSFVEEGNLTFNIRQLRKILGDDAHDPKYIKTVRRHGYRFIADVRQISVAEKTSENESETPPEDASTIFQPTETATAAALPEGQTKLLSRPANKTFPGPLFLRLAALLAVFLVVAAVGAGWWFEKSRGTELTAPILSAPFSIEKLSTDGKVVHAMISPDGKNMIYTSGKGSEKQSLWLRQLDEGVSIEIIPPSNDVYAGLAFAPDGKQFYFVRRSRLTADPAAIYRISIHGGIPNKIIDQTEGWMSLSPDGARISFIRCPRRDDESCSLWTADSADGANEKKIVSRQRPFRIGANRISPDGKTIVFAVGQSENAAHEFGLSEVDLETGIERELTTEKFFNIRHIAWLPDKSGWLLTASRIPVNISRIWQVSAATGKVTALTKDSEIYSILSMDKEATRIVSTQYKGSFHLRLLNLENRSTSKILADAGAADFAPDGKIYFTSIMSGKSEIWSINPDGSGQRQLTNDAMDKSYLIVSPDNKTIFFDSNKTGSAQVWRMNTDGTNQRQISQQSGFPLFVSPDGEWVYFQHGVNRTLWRVPANGGEEQSVLDKGANYFAFAPDGSRVAFSERQGEERILNIVSLADRQSVKTFHLADRRNRSMNIEWTPDGKNLIYVATDREYLNYTLWMQPLDQEAPRQLADLGEEEVRGFGFSVSPDGKTLAIVQGEWLHDAVLLKGLK